MSIPPSIPPSILLAVALLAAAGCKNSENTRERAAEASKAAADQAKASGIGGACNFPDQHICREYYGVAADTAKSQCNEKHGTFVTTCPIAEAVGRCVFAAGTAGSGESHTLWYPPLTRDGLLRACEGSTVRDP